MHIIRIFTIILVALCLLFLGFQVYELDVEAAAARAVLVITLTIFYYVTIQEKRLFFFLFLLAFSLAEIMNFSSWLVEIDYSITPDYFYYGTNMLFILSYIFLIIRILEDMNVKEIVSKFWIHIIILIVLDVFSVVIVSGTTEKRLSSSQYSLEFFYNSVIMVVLTVAMINYISKNTQKSMNLLLGAIFIFFSEVIQLTYFYISEINILNVICSLFLVLAFLFLYLQARIPAETEHNAIGQDFQY